MDGQGLRMCRFTRDGIPELGEYLESVDDTGICKLTELDGGGEEVVVCLPDGTMPEGIEAQTEQVFDNLADTGACGSAAVPLFLDHACREQVRGDPAGVRRFSGARVEGDDVGGGDEISSLVEGKATSLATAPGDSAGRTIFSYPTLFAQFVAYGEDCGSR